MRKATWLMLGGMAVLMFGSLSDAHAQKPSSEARIQRSVDGSSHQVLRSGVYRVVSFVGQPVVGGTLTSRSGGIWQWQQKRSAGPEAVSVNEMLEVPKVFALEANYPNPFNPETTIRFALPQASHVVIEVFDILGREVARLVDSALEAGNHSVVFEGGHLSSGIYVYQMTSGAFKQHRTMLLVK